MPRTAFLRRNCYGMKIQMQIYMSLLSMAKFMELIYGTTIFPRGKHSFERQTGRGCNSISFMVIRLAVLLRVYALTSYFCCAGT